jgi:hypothetical protein
VEMLGQAAAPAPAADADHNYLPEPCRLFPERVAELPDAHELEQGTRDRLETWIGANFSALLADGQVWPPAHGGPGIAEEAAYDWSFSAAPGTKVGGFPLWIQDVWYPSCQRGHEMEHLLTIASSEFDGGTWWRWLPAEERHVWAGPPSARMAVQAATDLMFGDEGNFYVFVCRVCDELPIRASVQCS